MAVDPVDGLEALELQLHNTDLLKENSRNRKFRLTGRARSAWTPSSETTDLLKENSGNRKLWPRNHRSFERKLWEQDGSGPVSVKPELRHGQTDVMNLYITRRDASLVPQSRRSWGRRSCPHFGSSTHDAPPRRWCDSASLDRGPLGLHARIPIQSAGGFI